MTPDSDNWQLLQDLFHLAEMTPEADRERVLAECCADEALRQRALTLLKAFTLDRAGRGNAVFGSLLRVAPTDV